MYYGTFRGASSRKGRRRRFPGFFRFSAWTIVGRFFRASFRFLGATVASENRSPTGLAVSVWVGYGGWRGVPDIHHALCPPSPSYHPHPPRRHHPHSTPRSTPPPEPTLTHIPLTLQRWRTNT